MTDLDGMDKNSLNQEEIEALPVITLFTMGNQDQAHEDLVYSPEGKLLGRLDTFKYSAFKKYYRELLIPVPNNEPSNGLDESEPEFWDTFAARPYPEQKWRIKNIVPDAGMVILAGASTEGKTWFAMEMCKAMAFGQPFLNEFEAQKSSVLYINQEMAKSELYRRGKLLGFDGSYSGIWVLNRNELNLNDEYNVEWLMGVIKQNK